MNLYTSWMHLSMEHECPDSNTPGKTGKKDNYNAQIFKILRNHKKNTINQVKYLEIHSFSKLLLTVYIASTG